MHQHKHAPHAKLQRRVLIGLGILAILVIGLGIPLITNDEFRYDLAMRTNSIPGGSVEKIAEPDEGAILVILPLEHQDEDLLTTWLYRAQFIAWPTESGIDLENLESGEHITLPITEIYLVSSNRDGTLVMMRGYDLESGDLITITIDPESMVLEHIGDAEAVPDSPGDWETSIWAKQEGRCHAGSPDRRFVVCFERSELAAYAAGDWQLNVQYWGDYEEQYPIFRGLGFLPFVGFAHSDTVIYFQNENGLWRTDVPEDVLEDAPAGIPFATPTQ